MARIVSLQFIIIILLLLVSCGKKESIQLSPEEALHKFYFSEVAEDQLKDPLILAGDKVVPLVLAEIKNKDMPRRRYAIGALGSIGNLAALPALETILNDGLEKDYFQCDALRAIAMIDFSHAKKLAKINLDRASSCLNWLGTEILETKSKSDFEKAHFKRTIEDAQFGRHY